MSDGRKTESDSEERSSNTVQICLYEIFILGLRQSVSCRTAKHLAKRMSGPREFDFGPLKRAARDLVEKPKAALRYRRQKHVDKITFFVDSDFAGDPVSRKSTKGLVAQIGGQH